MRLSLILVLATSVAVSPCLAQSIEVGADRASALKRDYPYVRFELLGGFDVPELSGSAFTRSPHARLTPAPKTLTVPAEVTALDGRRISVRGYMLPLEIADGGVRAFILTATIDACHFGALAQANQWMSVRVAPGRSVPPAFGTPITVFGTLAVRPEWESGTLTGLYRLTADAVAVH
jgi:hypothetical protein